LVGRFDYGGGRAILTVTREGDHLFAQLTGQPRFEIFPKSPSEFFWKVVNAQVTFVKDDSGKVIKAIHHQAGKTFDAPKMEWGSLSRRILKSASVFRVRCFVKRKT
jgi:hypothetical protein